MDNKRENELLKELIYDKTKIRFGFRGKNQMPLFMIWREYLNNNEVIYAEVLFEIN